MGQPKGCIPWNKGRSGVYSPECRERMSNGCRMSEAHKSAVMKNIKKATEANKVLWQDPEFRASMACKRKEIWARASYRAIISEHRRRVWLDEDYRRRQGEKYRAVWANEEYKNRMKQIRSHRCDTKEQREAISKLRKELWADPRYREKMLKHLAIAQPLATKAAKKRIITEEEHERRSREAKVKFANDPEYQERMRRMRENAWAAMAKRKPNFKEVELSEILESLFPGEWKYVGNWQVEFGGKCPDYMNVNGQKKLIELFGSAVHKPDEVDPRIAHFKEYGFATIVIWVNELKKYNRNNLIVKLRSFHHR